ncbi:MAG: M1 family metallopeptidase, partial [Chitinophagaceae bacterium]
EVENMQAIDNNNSLDSFGCKIDNVSDASGNPISYTINKTMMRVDLPKVLKPQQKLVFKIKWHYAITDRKKFWGRGGFEHFEDENDLFTITQWYPRLCVYSDFAGWQNHQFTGRGEFALTFGNFIVHITVPADHIVASTGECQNYNKVLSPIQLARFENAKNTDKDPVMIVTLNEAKQAEKKNTLHAGKTKTWIFKANNVRDFAWTSSRKYCWDAMYAAVKGKKDKVLCMSFYPKESYALYQKYSTKAVAHTLKTYSHFTIPYPYPVAQSVEASNGMEYPMICFNYGRTEKDGTYTQAAKWGMIGVIIHEVGHNFFPMIINSDERQWSWMDEGLNTFVQYLTEELFDPNYPTTRGPAFKITEYMRLPKEQLEPIMTNSENIIHFGKNAYAKAATGLNILRETIMGRELFDFAFKTYATRWAFKHPTPADFFRTMNDASAINLDWFWRGWFYDITPVDIALDSVNLFVPTTQTNIPFYKKDTLVYNPKIARPADISKQRNKANSSITFYVDRDTSLLDFYSSYKPDSIEKFIYTKYQGSPLTEEEEQKLMQNKYFYQLYFSNKGGMVMPLIIEFTYEDSTKETDKINTEIWRKNEKNVTLFYVKKKRVASIQIDPNKETADIDETNNIWPRTNNTLPTKFELYKKAKNITVEKPKNPMQKVGINNPIY